MKTGIIATALAFLLPLAAAADPIEKARFTLSGKEGMISCDGCRDAWYEAITETFKHLWQQKPKRRSARVVTGHIVRVELDRPNLEVLVTRRDAEGDCREFRDATRYDPEKVEQSLPVLLRTVEDWAITEDVDMAFSGSFFKFRDQGGVRAIPPCGEMIGVNLRDGHLDWPPADQPELLHENIDFNEAWPTYALLFNADRTADVALLTEVDQLYMAAHGIGGSALFTDNEFDPATGSKPGDPIARLGVGILEDRRTILIVKVEGQNNHRDKSRARGIRMTLFKSLFERLGAAEAINLDGSGSAHIVVLNEEFGESSRPADTEGARPIANHFGFKLHAEPVEWTSYGTRQAEQE